MFRTSDTAEDKSTDTKDKSVSTRLDPSSACSAPHTDHIVICRESR